MLTPMATGLRQKPLAAIEGGQLGQKVRPVRAKAPAESGQLAQRAQDRLIVRLVGDLPYELDVSNDAITIYEK
jgi:hypothetical protein